MAICYLITQASDDDIYLCQFIQVSYDVWHAITVHLNPLTTLIPLLVLRLPIKEWRVKLGISDPL